MRGRLLGFLACWLFAGSAWAQPGPVRVGIFAVDASPPIGSPLAYDPNTEVLLPLSCRGIVILGPEAPIVLCAIDWLGIGNDSHKVFRAALAKAVGTDASRVAVHTLHQHDAPACDFSTAALLERHGIARQFFNVAFDRQVMERAAAAARVAKENARPATHLALSEGIVEKVASNRRILGPDGKVKHVRWTATKDPAVRAEPVGTIDPALKMIRFFDQDQPLVALTYYATHPQSYYRTGKANPDFPGMARDHRQQVTGGPHVHFDGAGGNIGAGKWNDGSPANRQILADRVALGMEKAWASTKKVPLSPGEVHWRSIPVRLPVAKHLEETRLRATIENDRADPRARLVAANDLAWLRRCQLGDTIDIGCLALGPARILHLPGELFVEYQLAAQKLRPDLFVAMAAYGDYAPGYIGTAVAYTEGGYETEPRSSLVAPEVEGVLMEAIRRLLE